MERVAFLIERTGERIGCLLNPESLLFRRQAGVVTRHDAGGIAAGTGRYDDQLLCRGGGLTELTFNLLFDVSLAGSSGSSMSVNDVRDLTGPIWRLSENSADGTPPICRFVWGKSWHLPGIITSVAERFEYFNADGVPRRSWMRLRFRRVAEPVAPSVPERRAVADGVTGPYGSTRPLESHEVKGNERPDQIAAQCYGDPSLVRALMAHNNIDDPLHMPAGKMLDIPPLEKLEALL
ncbi:MULTISPECIES: bacteriophage T4, Gp53, baseplate wedge protein [Desulfococcus]|uniref:Bacteriophage T4, Gp53, baseplate wedge protein n=1 Tax=Desulfococcus multivorans DSM 2059 TaxID=1121405 RepID=S7U1T9_DESML|nr:bacteriophage T4, Gp53, baseplate wedge protein [Desulfococcus multivorans]AQV00781.1 hypothetical protein B2D07_08380 [Desulfococcus multivorans]EPR43252.1 Bacteriophage T4, Gp53, baseplate wedge protein [Desulfococcus multivorans DSM 2059]SJZ41227.1 hypothetical protein SAMN02745446_00394 [Desulfococcus multivorans DSM 2059]